MASDESYKVLIPCRNDKTRKRYKPGQVVTKKELAVTMPVIQNWLEIGVLETAKVTEKEVESDGKREE